VKQIPAGVGAGSSVPLVLTAGDSQSGNDGAKRVDDDNAGVHGFEGSLAIPCKEFVDFNFFQVRHELLFLQSSVSRGAPIHPPVILDSTYLNTGLRA
jgi:hypothetical protein